MRASRHGRRARLAALAAFAVVAAILGSGCGKIEPLPTGAPTRTQAPVVTSSGCLEHFGATVHWYLGFGSGTGPAQSEAERKAMYAINLRNYDACVGTNVNFDNAPHALAYGALATAMASDHSPCIVGPIGTGDLRGFEDLFLDLTPEIAKANYDLTQFDPTLVRSLSFGGYGPIGLPYTISPGFIWFNRDIFRNASLPEPPTKIGETYRDEPWTWDALGKDFPGSDARHVASFFGGATPVAADGKTARIPAAWMTAFNWYYDAIWKGHFVPNAAAESSALLAHGNSQASGKVAMTASLASLASIATDAKSSKVATWWDIAVVPSSGGATTAPLDVETFVIPKTCRDPSDAFQVILDLMSDPALLEAYGRLPADRSKRADFFKSMDARLAYNQVSWSVLGEMASVPAIPSPESDMPNVKQSETDISVFFKKLGSTRGINVDQELRNLQETLQRDFKMAAHVPAT